METDPLYAFLSAIGDDPRVTCAHISVYMALWKKWKDNRCPQPLSFFRSDLAPLCKLSSYNSYHKTIRQLHEFGYIKYLPSYNHFLGSQVYFIGNEKKQA
jgi:hypothetical protein